METLETQRGKDYIQLSEPGEVDRFRINDVGGPSFSLLRDLGMKDYESTFKSWLRKFPRPIFIVCAVDREIHGWAYGEEWEDSANDGEPVYVLRAIETAEEKRKKGIGYRLLVLMVRETPGYLITKPITEKAREFFLNNGFLDKDEMEREVIDLQSHPGYLILPPFRKNKLLDDYEEYFESE